MFIMSRVSIKLYTRAGRLGCARGANVEKVCLITNDCMECCRP